MTYDEAQTKADWEDSMNTDKPTTTAKRGRPYKNPHLMLPPGVTIINKDELKQMREEIANLKAQIEQTKADNEDSTLQ